jgi:hypothetical protein
MVFFIKELSLGRWLLTNSITEVSHVTYGTEEEVLEQAQRQSILWEARTKNKRGSPWKKTPSMQ